MSYWRLYYHLVWVTRERQPYITNELEPALYGFIVGKVESLGGKVKAIGGIENHIHLITSIPPNFSVADFVKRIKGSSSHHLNNDLRHSIPYFSWQGGYGAFSVSSNQLERASEYVVNQKIHHQKGTTFAPLENCGEEPVSQTK